MDNLDGSTTQTASASASSAAAAARAGRYALNGKIMLCTVVILFVAVFAILGFHSYARWSISRRRRSVRSRRRRRSAPAAADSSSGGGLDVSVLKSLSVFTFAGSGNGDVGQFVECAVCVSDFEDGETGRRLPECEHVFHADCIDTWFESHSSCPLCRAPVQADVQAATEVAPPEDVGGAAAAQGAVWLIEVSEDETSMSSSLSLSPTSLPSCCGSCSSPPPPRKAAELEEITVEEPPPPPMEERYKELEKMGLPERNRSQSPGYRILSLKRIWSI